MSAPATRTKITLSQAEKAMLLAVDAKRHIDPCAVIYQVREQHGLTLNEALMAWSAVRIAFLVDVKETGAHLTSRGRKIVTAAQTPATRSETHR